MKYLAEYLRIAEPTVQKLGESSWRVCCGALMVLVSGPSEGDPIGTFRVIFPQTEFDPVMPDGYTAGTHRMMAKTKRKASR